MWECIVGLLGAALGLGLYFWGYRQGAQARPAAKTAPPMTPEQELALAKAVRERYNFLNFEGDPLSPEG